MACCNRFSCYRILPLLMALCFAPLPLAAEERLSVIPQPSQVAWLDGSCDISELKRILVVGDIKPIRVGVVQLQQSLRDAGSSVKLRTVQGHPGKRSAGAILVNVQDLDEGLDDESYIVEINPTTIEVNSKTPAGIHNACQTIRQCIDALRGSEVQRIPCVVIHDEPTYPWRGLLVDVARHLFSVEDLEKFVDTMAYYKFNRLHLHLTDDQGWRLPVRKLPRLTSVGAYRLGAAGDLTASMPPDSEPYGGYYTHKQIRRLVKFASERNITIVPEIEMPGHATAALAAYPEVSCNGGPYTVENRLGIFENNFCPGKEETFELLEVVIAETAKLFPSEFLHLGGDEVKLTRWQECPDCQRRVAEERLTSTRGLQSYFVRRVEAIVARHGKRIVLWEEASAKELSDQAVIMSWLGVEAGVNAANEGHKVVFCPHQALYFDYTYDSNSTREAYGFSPYHRAILPKNTNSVLGAQGNLWTERIHSLQQLQTMAMPRAVALAEALWSPPGSKDWQNFVRRLDVHQRTWQQNGVTHHPIPTKETVN